jgi:hypothetical protein
MKVEIHDLEYMEDNLVQIENSQELVNREDGISCSGNPSQGNATH